MRFNGRGSRRWRTALHEAGHVLMAVEYGCPFGDVALAGTGEANGTMSRISIASCAIAGDRNRRAFKPVGRDSAALLVIAPTRFGMIAAKLTETHTAIDFLGLPRPVP
jgi:hypothetical protein